MVFTFFVYYSCRSPRSLLRRSTSFRVPPSLVFNNKTKLRRPIILHVLPFLLRESNDSYIFQTKVLPSVFFPFFFSFFFHGFVPCSARNYGSRGLENLLTRRGEPISFQKLNVINNCT